MKAAIVRAYGDAGNLIIGDIDIPHISPTQVLIQVVAAGVNPVDFHVRNGAFEASGMHELPLVPGWDVAGIVADTGGEVTNLAVGDEVFTFSPIGQQGAYAEYLAVDADFVVTKPACLSFIEAAAVPLAALTAWQGLLGVAQLVPGQRVLIHGASGGVGGFAIQIAKEQGAYVIGTASAKNERYVRALGVDEFIDYTSVAFEKAVNDIDLVYAAVGGDDVLSRALTIINPGGWLISTFDEISESELQAHELNYMRPFVTSSGADLGDIGNLITQGKIRVPLDSVFPLDMVQHAHHRSESRRAVGKIVLNVDPSITGRMGRA